MEHDVERIVLLPRFTSFSGARSFYGPPLNARAYASANIMAWASAGIGTSPSFGVVVQESPDLKIWTTNATLGVGAGTESTDRTTFSLEWIRCVVTLSGTNPGFTCWAVGDFLTRAPKRN